jgi:hypothetical protein
LQWRPKETSNNNPLAPIDEAHATIEVHVFRRRAPTMRCYLRPLRQSIKSPRQSEKGTPMSTDKSADSRAGAPAAKKPAEGQRFDLFRTFRHPPKPDERVRAPKSADKPKE